jgi:endonuclease/exonuclease/phosphatase family metal-dependent hydrolase
VTLLPFLTLSMLLFYTAMAVQQLPSSASVSKSDTESNSKLLETGTTATVRQPPTPNSEIKIISYNIRWRGGEELNKIIKILREDPDFAGATLLGLQEVDRNRKRTGNKNTAKQLAEALDYHYAWTAPPSTSPGDEEGTGVAILSAYPLSDVTRIVLPNPGPGKRRRVALGASVNIGGTTYRFYSVHAETRISVTKKVAQMNAVIQDLAQYPKDTPAIILGDFNTWEPDADSKTIELFKAAGFRTPFGGQSTFKRQILFVPLKLRLDWIWLRGLEPVNFGIGTKIDISDHWPLWLNLKQAPKAK